ncbi:MAG: hypothetical protein R2757_19820 [Draconibacterium sp.]
MVYKFWRKISPWEKKNNRIAVIWKIAITFTFITATRIFFRSESMRVVRGMIRRLATTCLKIIPDVLWAYKWVFLVMLFGFITHWLSYNFKEKMLNWFIKMPLWAKAVIAAVVVIVVYQSIFFRYAGVYLFPV